MKKKVLLSSILTIFLCLCLISGSTFALFTSKAEVNIVVKAGEVNMTAGIAITKLESVKADANGTITDENGGTYSYEEVSPNFTNGGTADVTGGTLTLEKITPGDKVTFEISGTNTSDVATQYYYSIECTEGYKLMSGLNVYVTAGGTTTEYSSLASYTSAWYTLAAKTDIAPVTVAVELPVDAGNEYQKLTTAIKVTVFAVQGNAATDAISAPEVVYIPTVTDETELKNALLDSTIPAVNISDSIDTQLVISEDLSNKTIIANGNNVTLQFTGALDNVVVSGIVDNGDAVPAIQFAGATGNVTIKDSYLIDENHQPYGAIAGSSADLSITIENCEIEGARPVYSAAAIKDLTMIGCTIHDSSSWAVLDNSDVLGSVVIDGCTFKNCVGIYKATRAISGNFTFTNNTLEDCTLKNGYYVDVKVNGDITVSGNTMIVGGVETDNDVTAADLLGVVKN